METIRIAKIGINDKPTYTYPEKFDDRRSGQEWINFVGDPRYSLRNLDSNEEESYVLGRNDVGLYYGILRKDLRDSRDGIISVYLFVGNSYITSGRTVLKVLRQLMDLLICTDTPAENEVQECVDSLSKCQRSFNGSIPFAMKSDDGMTAFRTYENDNELEKILQNPNQTVYRGYPHIYIVKNKEFYAQKIPGLNRIIDPVKDIYSVNKDLPHGVSVDRDVVEEGQWLKITYTKSNCDSVICSIPIKRNSNGSREFSWQGNEIFLKSAEEAGITFKRRFTLTILCDGRTIPLNSCNLSLDGQPVNPQDNNSILIPDNKGPHSLKIECTGYEIKQVQLQYGENSQTIDLKPKLEQVSFYVDNHKIKVLATHYNATLLKNRHLVYESNNIIQKGENNGKDIEANKRKNKRKKHLYKGRVIRLVIGAVLVLVVMWGLKYWHPFGIFKESEDTKKYTRGVLRNNEDNAEANAKADSIHDVKYLKNIDTWVKDSLKIADNKKLIDYLKNGQIQELQNSNYNKLPNDKQNGFWRQIIEAITKDGNNIKDILKDEGNGQRDSINLRKKVSAITNMHNSQTSTNGPEEQGAGSTGEPNGNGISWKNKKSNDNEGSASQGSNRQNSRPNSGVN